MLIFSIWAFIRLNCFLHKRRPPAAGFPIIFNGKVIKTHKCSENPRYKSDV